MINEVKKYVLNKFKSSRPMMILIGSTFLFIFILNVTKTEPELLVLEEKIWPVSAVKAEYQDVQPTLNLFGEVISSRRSDLRAFVGGQVVEVGSNFKEGAIVEEGELLLVIDDFEYANAVVEEEAKFEIMKRDFERAEELFSQGSISEQFRDNALLEKTRQELVLSEVKKDLRDTRLYAPYDGVINDVLASLGKQVSTFNDKIGEIIDVKNLEVKFSISKAQYGRLLEDENSIIGRSIDVRWAVGQKDLLFSADISRIGAEIKSNTGGVNVFASINFPDNEVTPLRPGAFVRLGMPDKSYESVIVIPDSALYEDSYVYLIRDGRLAKHMVKIHGYDKTNVLITPSEAASITNDDMIVTNQLREAGEGVKVEVI